MAGYDTAWNVLSENRDGLEAITQALMEYETITGEECATLMRGEKIIRPSDDDETKGPIGSAVPVAGKAPKPPREEPDAGGMEPQPDVRADVLTFQKEGRRLTSPAFLLSETVWVWGNDPVDNASCEPVGNIAREPKRCGSL